MRKLLVLLKSRELWPAAVFLLTLLFAPYVHAFWFQSPVFSVCVLVLLACLAAWLLIGPHRLTFGYASIGSFAFGMVMLHWQRKGMVWPLLILPILLVSLIAWIYREWKKFRTPEYNEATAQKKLIPTLVVTCAIALGCLNWIIIGFTGLSLPGIVEQVLVGTRTGWGRWTDQTLVTLTELRFAILGIILLATALIAMSGGNAEMLIQLRKMYRGYRSVAGDRHRILIALLRFWTAAKHFPDILKALVLDFLSMLFVNVQLMVSLLGEALLGTPMSVAAGFAFSLGLGGLIGNLFDANTAWNIGRFWAVVLPLVGGGVLTMCADSANERDREETNGAVGDGRDGEEAAVGNVDFPSRFFIIMLLALPVLLLTESVLSLILHHFWHTDYPAATANMIAAGVVILILLGVLLIVGFRPAKAEKQSTGTDSRVSFGNLSAAVQALRTRLSRHSSAPTAANPKVTDSTK